MLGCTPTLYTPAPPGFKDHGQQVYAVATDDCIVDEFCIDDFDALERSIIINMVGESASEKWLNAYEVIESSIGYTMSPLTAARSLMRIAMCDLFIDSPFQLCLLRVIASRIVGDPDVCCPVFSEVSRTYLELAEQYQVDEYKTPLWDTLANFVAELS